MQGTVLVLDPVATSRIMLKVQLSAAFYRVALAQGLNGVRARIGRVRPDVILCALDLPDGSVFDLCEMLQDSEDLAEIPVVALVRENDQQGRLRALAAGAADVLTVPADDLLLQARLRNLMRGRHRDRRLRQSAATGGALAEAAAPFRHPRRVEILSRDGARAAQWHRALAPMLPQNVTLEQSRRPSAENRPDIVLLALDDARSGEFGPDFVANLRARQDADPCAIITISTAEQAALAADSLDRGADDAISTGFCAQEVAFRLNRQIHRLEQHQSWRQSVDRGLRAALRDPMTGLFNRRHALPYLERALQRSRETGQPCAVLVADLDHFKRINDRFGHPIGDQVLVEAARLQAALPKGSMLARIGGEEFLIVLEAPNTLRAALRKQAQSLCEALSQTPVPALSPVPPIDVTLSVGAALSSAADETAQDLIARADHALYAAKEGGRNSAVLCPGSSGRAARADHLARPVSPVSHSMQN